MEGLGAADRAECECELLGFQTGRTFEDTYVRRQ